MKVLIIHNSYRQPGGEDILVEQERALLQHSGHEVIEYRRSNHETNILGLWGKFTLPKRVVWAGNTIRDLRALIHQEKPDVVHFHNTFLLISPSAYYACWESGVPVVQTLHNYRLICPTATFYRDGHACEDCLGRTPPWPGIVHACYRGSRAQTAVVSVMLTLHRWFKTWQKQVDLYIALTEFALKKFVEGGLPVEKIVVKPNFVYPDPGMREGDGHYALFVGRLSPEKGLQTLLKAWQYLQGIPLKIVGDGPLRDEIQTFVETQKLEGLQVLGRHGHDGVLELMKGARYLVFPSECYENFPVATAEAFACGVPVITSRLGAMAEIVEDGRTGLHFEPGNSEDLAAKVEWAWTHPEAMSEMGREARREYEEKYTAEKNYKMLLDIYERALSYHKRSSL